MGDAECQGEAVGVIDAAVSGGRSATATAGKTAAGAGSTVTGADADAFVLHYRNFSFIIFLNDYSVN
jgi:hypothetical protein